MLGVRTPAIAVSTSIVVPFPRNLTRFQHEKLHSRVTPVMTATILTFQYILVAYTKGATLMREAGHQH